MSGNNFDLNYSYFVLKVTREQYSSGRCRVPEYSDLLPASLAALCYHRLN